MFVHEQGGVVSGDEALAAFAFDLKNRGRLQKQTVVGTVMSNFGFEAALKKSGISLVRTPVGDRYILERLWDEEQPCLEGMDPDDPICQEIVENIKWAWEQVGDKGVEFIK